MMAEIRIRRPAVSARARRVGAMLGLALASASARADPVDDPALAGDPISRFTGHWRVARVAVSDTGIQALADNDPSLMGKRLTMTQTRLAWARPPATGDVCTGPRFAPLERLPPDVQPRLAKLGLRRPVAYTVRCQSGTWGPGRDPVIYRGAKGTLALPWYDGAVLMLVREPM